MKSINKKKGVRKMRTVYIIRRIVVTIVAAIVMTLLAMGVTKVSQLMHEESPTCNITAVTVEKDDTLWGIAEKHCSDHLRTGETVSKIIAINNGIVNIRVGQVINLPFKKGEK